MHLTFDCHYFGRVEGAPFKAHPPYEVPIPCQYNYSVTTLLVKLICTSFHFCKVNYDCQIWLSNWQRLAKAALTQSTKPTRLYAKWLNSTSCSLRGQYVNLEGNQPYHTKSTRTQHAYVRRKPVDNTKSMRSVHDLCRS